MTDLTEFLLERIAEEQMIAQLAILKSPNWLPCWSAESDYRDVNDGAAAMVVESATNEEIAEHIALHGPARVIAECDAKRSIIRGCADVLSNPSAPEAVALADDTLRTLAGLYTQADGYDPAWRL